MLLSKQYKFKLGCDYTYQHDHFNEVSFCNDWIAIENGALRVKSGYTWDGCTPKIHVAGLFSVGVPDGVLRHGLPWTYHASLVHDALCQFRHELPLTKRQVVQVFKGQLTEANWPLASLYARAIEWFGPQDFLI